MGFNNAGAAALADRLRSAGVRRGNGAVGIPVGDLHRQDQGRPRWPRPTEDYLASLRLLAPYADYVAVNVSSPNTPGLRALQDADTLAALVAALITEAARLAAGAAARADVRQAGPRPDRGRAGGGVDVVERAGAAGLIATNTTLARDGHRPRAIRTAGGEAGRAVRCTAHRPGPGGGRASWPPAPTCR